MKDLVQELIASTSSPSLALKFSRLWGSRGWSIKREGDEDEERNCGTVLPQALHHLPPGRLLQLNKHKCYVKVKDVNKWSLYASTTCLIACPFIWKLVEEIKKVPSKAALHDRNMFWFSLCSSALCWNIHDFKLSNWWERHDKAIQCPWLLVLKRWH